MGNNLQTQRVF